MKYLIIVSIFTLHLFQNNSYSQNGSYLDKNPKHKAYTDSLMRMNYKGSLPFYGKKAYKKGFDIPYPVGIMGNVLWLSQDLVFSEFKLGLQTPNLDIEPREIEVLEFGRTRTTASTITFRPDVWVLPFLNIYGILGFSDTQTDVTITAPISLQSVVNQRARTLGFGVMGAGGIGPVFFSVDANFTWSKPDLLTTPVQVNVLGMRIGHSFKFKHRPDRNIAAWVGTMRVSMTSSTVGEITLNEALPDETWEKKDALVDSYWDWYNSLNPNKLEDIKKIATADKVLTPIVTEIDNRNGESVVRYEMQKEVQQRWNFLIGAQFQINKHWQIRSEGGIIGNRKSFLASLNYRFIL